MTFGWLALYSVVVDRARVVLAAVRGCGGPWTWVSGLVLVGFGARLALQQRWASGQNPRAVSRRMVTGPSPADSTRISAPKRPVATGTPGAGEGLGDGLDQGGGPLGRGRGDIGGAAALAGVAVEGELADHQRAPAGVGRERFILPWSSSNTRRAATLAASQAASASVSPWVTPTRTSSPGPISPVSSPSATTRAQATRDTTARTYRSPLPFPACGTTRKAS